METMRWQDESLYLIDQTKLPHTLEYVQCTDYLAVAKAIKIMQVRGAPAIGAAAAFGVALGAKQYKEQTKVQFLEKVSDVIVELAQTRPTAVNLFWALNRMRGKLKQIEDQTNENIYLSLVKEAQDIHQEDIDMNRKMGKFGNELIPQGARILTHCNAGALATAGFGTALGVIRAAQEAGKDVQVYADETRPLLQGARLTAWELMQDNIPVTLVTDNMAGYLMRKGMVDLVIVGADRITANGDVANKIGTYGVAVLAKENKIPFYVAAPTSTIDLSLKHGDEIVIEERGHEEIIKVSGNLVAPEGVKVFNPAFDVTPNHLVTAIITDKGVIKPPYIEGLAKFID